MSNTIRTTSTELAIVAAELSPSLPAKASRDGFANVERIPARRPVIRRRSLGRLTATDAEMTRQEQLRLDGIAAKVAIEVRNAWDDFSRLPGDPLRIDHTTYRDRVRAARAWGKARGVEPVRDSGVIEYGLSDCEHGCKVYRDGDVALGVSHSRTYGCPLG